ncbi:MAG: DUF4097 family beta strand repeat protein [Deltaproteobacteria bacterium]|nr:DUF4097 family beta strand repeat protein [Deltaproteobacteria bacterium]
MKKVRSAGISIIFVLLALFSLFAYADVEEVINKQYPLERDGAVRLKNISGNIAVTTWDKNEIKIEARKRADSQKELDKIHVDIDSHDSRISINTEYDKSFHFNFFSGFDGNRSSVDYELIVPDKAEISLESVSGDIRVSSIGGDLKSKTVSGGIKVVSAVKDVTANSVSGSIYLEGAADDATLETVSGKITVNELMGAVSAKTVSGGIDLMSGSEVKGARAETVSGSIRAKYILGHGVHSYKSVSGGIRIELPADSGFSVTAKTFSGSINTDFAITLSGKIDNKNIKGIAGNGGPELSLESFSGSIMVEKR